MSDDFYKSSFSAIILLPYITMSSGVCRKFPRGIKVLSQSCDVTNHNLRRTVKGTTIL